MHVYCIHFALCQSICPSCNSGSISVQGKLGITRSLGPRNFAYYIRYLVISVVNKQYKTKQIMLLGPKKTVCYIRYFFISDLFISSFHCIWKISTTLHYLFSFNFELNSIWHIQLKFWYNYLQHHILGTKITLLKVFNITHSPKCNVKCEVHTLIESLK